MKIASLQSFSATSFVRYSTFSPSACPVQQPWSVARIEAILLDRLRFESEGASMTATIMPLGAAGIWLEEHRRTSHRNKENSLNRSWDKGEPLGILEIRKTFRDGEGNPQKWSQSNNALHGMLQRERGKLWQSFQCFSLFSDSICACVCVWMCVSDFERTTTAVARGEFSGPLCRLQNSPLSLSALSLFRSHFPHWVTRGNFLPLSLSLTFFLSHISWCVGDTFFGTPICVCCFLLLMA